MKEYIVYVHRPVVNIERAIVKTNSEEEAIEIAKSDFNVDWEFVEETESGLCHSCSNWEYECKEL